MKQIKFTKKVFLTVIFIIPASILFSFLYLINFFQPVRIGSLNAKGRISIMISYIEPYLRSLQLDGIQHPIIFVINPGLCPNEQLKKMYKRAVWFLDDDHPILRHIFNVMYLRFALHTTLGVQLVSGNIKKFSQAWQDGTPILNFTKEEEEKGQELLRRMGIPKNAEYICFGLRESEYYKQFTKPGASAKELNSEANDDTFIRNPRLQNYLYMANECTKKEIYVLRMGQIVGEKLLQTANPKIIDYASRYRTEFGDIYLLAHCKFVVAGGIPGLWWISTAFNKPVVWTDSYCLRVRCLRTGDLFIPHKLKSLKEKRFLTFNEMLEANLQYSYKSNCLRDDISIVHNSAKEINEVVQEMNLCLDGRWKETALNKKLQKLFDCLYLPSYEGYQLPGKMGANFLNNNKNLLK